MIFRNPLDTTSLLASIRFLFSNTHRTVRLISQVFSILQHHIETFLVLGMSSFRSTSQQRRHASWFEETDTNDAHERYPSCNEEFKHPSQIILPRDQLSNTTRFSPTGQSESDRSSPSEVFSPASSAVSSASSATFVSSDSTSGITSPTTSSTSCSGSSASASGSDYFLPRGISRNHRNIPNILHGKTNPRRRVVSSSWSRPSLVHQEQRRQYLVEQLVGKLKDIRFAYKWILVYISTRLGNTPCSADLANFQYTHNLPQQNYIFAIPYSRDASPISHQLLNATSDTMVSSSHLSVCCRDTVR